MRGRRDILPVSVTGQTARDELGVMTEMVQESDEAQGKIRIDRSHFEPADDLSLDFEIVDGVSLSNHAI